MGHISGPNSHVSIAILVRLLLAMAMEIWDRESGAIRPIFAFFAILGQLGNTISPWGKGASRDAVAMFVAYDQGSMALELHICSSCLPGGMQLMVRAGLPNFALLAVFCPDDRPSPRGTAGNQRDRKPNPDARYQWGYQGP